MSYLQKRGHLSAVALGRKMFAGVLHMTPARFDLMHVLYQNMRTCPLARVDRMMPQAEIAPRLGLRRQTVFKMLKRLIELGYIDKYRSSGDGRYMLVGLTDEGIERIEQAYEKAFTEKYAMPPRIDGARPPRWVRRIAFQKALDEKFYADTISGTIKRKGFYYPPDPHGLWFGSIPKRPPKFGREVGRVFMTLAWQRAGSKNRERRLDALTSMLRDAQTIAKALGDTSELIYPGPPPFTPRKTGYVHAV